MVGTACLSSPRIAFSHDRFAVGLVISASIFTMCSRLSSRTRFGTRGVTREIRRRTRVVGAFPHGQSALNLAAARLRHIAGTAWSTKRYLNIELLKDQE